MKSSILFLATLAFGASCKQLAPYETAAAPVERVDGGVADSASDRFLADAPPGDSAGDTSADLTVVDAPGVDAAVDATVDAGPPLLFALQTTSVAPDVFHAYADKSGAVLRWDLGDGTSEQANRIDHPYTQAGKKIVQVRSDDGAAGLTLLRIGGAALVGSIPSELGQLTSLVSLYLDENQLWGPIPTSLGQLVSLEQLVLDTNQLSGSIPLALGQLVQLRDLHLHSNQLSGAIPAELGQLASLSTLLLSDNQLSGSIPSQLGQLTRLVSLFLSYNQLSGSLPRELGQLAALQMLRLDHNQLAGAIPTELGQLAALSNLDLSSNQLTAYEAGAFTGLTHIAVIAVHDNLLDQVAVDAVIGDLYQDRGLHTFAGTKQLALGGTNAAPSTAACDQVQVLRASYGWAIDVNGC